MTPSAVLLRPVGDSERALLLRRVESGVRRWATDWLAQGGDVQVEWAPVAPSISVASHLQVPGKAQLWSKQSQIHLGRACVLEGDLDRGDTRLDQAYTRLGASAIHELLLAVAEQPLGTPTVAWQLQDQPWPHLEPDWLDISIRWADYEIHVGLARPVYAVWLSPLRQPPQRLAPVKLPMKLGRTPRKLTVLSRPFELDVNEFLQMRPGTVLTMHQPLDTDFLVAVQDHPDATLKSYPGRKGAAFAVEIFEK